MRYFEVNPEVPAELGDLTVMENKDGARLIIHKLHLNFKGWLGGDLMETTPVFYITEKLKQGLIKHAFTGIQAFEPVEYEIDDEYTGSVKPGVIYWLKINGKSMHDDFGIDEGVLIVSEKALNFLKQYNLSDAEIVEKS